MTAADDLIVPETAPDAHQLQNARERDAFR
jgi:hypothetical protein